MGASATPGRRQREINHSVKEIFMCNRLLSLCLTFFTAFYAFTSAASAVTIDWVTVGDPGNACDTQPQGCFGAVSYEYRIGKFEVTNAQYADF